MPDSAPNAELLNALGRLVRGLSALFWGLPIALVVCVQTAKGDWFRPLGVFPPLLATGLLFYGLHLLGNFQKQERIWLAALDRAKIFAVINIGLSPFLYWWSKIPGHPFYNAMISCMVLTGLMLLRTLNPVLWRLTAMLPDETLRMETKLFTTFNRYVLGGILGLVTIYFLLARANPPMLDQIFDFFFGLLPFSIQSNVLFNLLDKGGLWVVLFLILLPVAMTMALIWKIKEVILASVFGADH